MSGVLATVRLHNEVRAASNREHIGGLFFLIALGMVQYAVAIGMVQSYVLPLKRFEHLNRHLANPKYTSVLYSGLLVGLYFLISATGGMTGFIVSSSILFLWLVALILVGSIRRWIRHNQEEEEEEEDPDAADGADMLDETPIAAPPKTAASRRMGRRAAIREQNPWTSSPAPMAAWQLASILIGVGLLVLNVIIIIMIVYIWSIAEYRIVSPQADPMDEHMPQMTAKALQFMYAHPKIATRLQLDVYTKLLTEYCGVTFNKNLTESGEDKEKLIQEEWIDEYSINMSVFVRTHYSEYHSVNDWFTRAIKPEERPLSTNVNAITSPADARTLVFEAVESSQHWVKGSELDVQQLIGHVSVEGDAGYFNAGGLLLSRLAPQDYHRFHAPVDGTVESITWIPGTLWSVGSDAVQSENDVFYNQRYVILIDAGATGHVALVAIGATCVGSVLLQRGDGSTLAVGDVVQRGDQLGIMQFGGSTIATVFRQDRVQFDDSLVDRSRVPVETLIQVNQYVGETRT